MSFDPSALAAALAGRESVARVVVARAEGSAPRDAGAAMLVWDGGQSGTIGGGALELAAAGRAREALASGRDRIDRSALGPGLGQCCGGAVTVLIEVWTRSRLAGIAGEVVARQVPGGPEEMPLGVHRALAAARSAGKAARPELLEGWMIEPVSHPARSLWIYGAGHVGRALVGVLAPLPDFAVTWVDTAPDRFPETVPEQVTVLVASNPAEVVRFAPREAEHLVLTYSHALDLELCHRLLGHGFARAGLIGSKTKWARFRSRLAALGHAETEIARIDCPIGDPSLGKHPQAIAVSVAHGLLIKGGTKTARKDRTG